METVPQEVTDGDRSLMLSSAKTDMHCHSTASEVSKLGIQRSVGLPECATPPEEVYDLAKRSGMEFVTITDHDTIDGVLEIADRPDVFISEELTTWFAGEPQAVHVLCYGITPADHEWLQAHAGDVESCAAYLHEHGITCALAHPFYAVEAPLTARHRRRLAELFPIWEIRNGSRARELNLPAAVYIETHGGTGVGGSDDHAGVDIGRTYTETPIAATPEAFLAHIRNGMAEAKGAQGSAAKWAHSAMALAARALYSGDPAAPGSEAEKAAGVVSPDAVLKMAERVVSEGNVRSGEGGADLGPEDARALLKAWLDRVDLDGDPRELVTLMQDQHFSHSDLQRRARSAHERLLRSAVSEVTGAATRGQGYGDAVGAVFDSCVPAIPYVAAATFLGGEKAKLAQRDGEPGRIALVVDAIGSMHGVSHTLERVRELGVPGFEVEVIGTDPAVDRRLPAVAEVEVPFYAGMRIGVPAVPSLVETIAEGRYDMVHLASPGPAGIAAALVARIGKLPTLGSYHTELAAYAGLRTGDPAIERGMRIALSLFYGQCERVLSPSAAADLSLRSLGIDEEKIGRWARGVDLFRFDPLKRDEDAYPGEIRVLYAGRLTKEKGADLLADSFLMARESDPRLHLLLAGGGPEEEMLRERVGEHATFLGWLEGEELAKAYASSDVFLFCSQTDTFGQVIVEAQASGVPVVAVDAGGPASLVRDRDTGLLRPPDAVAVAGAVTELARSPGLRHRLGAGGRSAARERTWERSMGELATGYEIALARAAAPETTPVGPLGPTDIRPLTPVADGRRAA